MTKRHSKKYPVIGFTLDHEQGGGYSKMPWYAIRENYCSAVSTLGALPIGLPHEPALVSEYLDILDGLIITGGAFDIPPSMYGDNSQHETVVTKSGRTQFEWAITQGMIERKKPVLGICGGEQLLNVVLGGTLIQHIPDSVKDALEHEQKNPRTEPGHRIKIELGTLLHTIAGTLEANINSAHHQAVAKVAPGMLANSYADDGVIEGIELSASMHPFCLGVQWHPEYHVDAIDTKIFAAFVAACGK